MSNTSQEIDENSQRNISRFKVAYSLCLVTVIGLTIVYVFQSFYKDFMYVFSNTVPTLFAGAALVSSLFALKRYWYDIRSRLSRTWLCFTLGMLLWFLGEFGWAFYTMVLNIEIPYPSIADVFWLGGYVPLLIALLLYVQLLKPAISAKIFLWATTIDTSISVMFFSPIIIPILLEASGQDLGSTILNLAYPSFDLILFLITLLGLLVFTITKLKGRLGMAWHLINTAILLNIFGDVAFAYTTSSDTYYNGHPLELLFLFGYLFFTLAFYVHKKEF